MPANQEANSDSDAGTATRPLAGNVVRLYAFRFLRDFLLIMPAMVPVYRAAGLHATDMLLVQAIFSLATVVFEVPSGFVADVLGRRRALLIGSGLMSLGMAGYGLALGFWEFVLSEIVLAAGYSLFSGTESALLFDTLAVIGQDDRYHRLEGRGEAFTRIGTATAAILGGLLAGLWVRLPFFVNMGTALVMVLIAITFVEPPRARLGARTPLRTILHVAKVAFSNPTVLPIMVLGAAVLAVGIVGIWGSFLRLSGAGITVLSYGVYFAVFQAASALGASQSARYFDGLGRTALPVALGLMATGPIGLAMSGAWWPVLVTPVGAFAWGALTPWLLERQNREFASEHRATALSVSALQGRILFVVVSPLFGWLCDRHSDRMGFLFLLLLWIALLAMAGLLALRRRKG